MVGADGTLKVALSPAVHPALKGPLGDVPQDKLVQVELVPSIRQYFSAAFIRPAIVRAETVSMNRAVLATRAEQVCILEQ